MRATTDIKSAVEIDFGNLPPQEVIRADVERCVCPFCGAGPFKSVAMHTNQAHGINRHKLRELGGFTTQESIAAPEYSRRRAKQAREAGSVKSMAGYVESLKGKPKPIKLTDAGKAKISRTVKATNGRLTAAERSTRAREMSNGQSPEARAAQGRSLSEWHAANPMSQEARKKAVSLLQSKEAQAKRRAAMDAKLQPCGTVAAYKRGCRCGPCREAKRKTR